MAKGKTQRYYDNNPEAKKKKKKYDTKYNSSKKQKKHRAKRNAARRKMIMKYGKKALKNKDVDHKKGVEAGNGDKNLRVTSKKKNRGRK